jgi:hypothetical protein
VDAIPAGRAEERDDRRGCAIPSAVATLPIGQQNRDARVGVLLRCRRAQPANDTSSIPAPCPSLSSAVAPDGRRPR